MRLAGYLGLLHRAQADLAAAFREVAGAHREEPDVELLCRRQAEVCDRHVAALRPFVERYRSAPAEPFGGARGGGGLLPDLHRLYLMATECDICWTLIGQAAQGVRDRDLLAVVQAAEGETALQVKWLRTRMKQAAPQALVVAGS